MQLTYLIPALAVLANAAPNPSSSTHHMLKRQVIDFVQINEATLPTVQTPPILGSTDVVPIQPASAAASIADAAVAASHSNTARSLAKKDLDVLTNEERSVFKRDGDCSVQPAGTGPAVNNPDTAAAWLANTNFTDTANAAATPDGYTLAFIDLQASTQTTSYLGYQTLDSYDTDACAASCDAVDGCQGFNIYYERDPSLDPNTDSCPNPTSITNIKCAIWGVQLSACTATNDGQWRDTFEVVITGSNGYNKNAPPPCQDGFYGPVELGGAILAPLDPVTNHDTYITYTFFAFGDGDNEIQYYNPEVCTSSCTATTAFDIQLGLGVDGQGPPAVCNMVVAYVLSDENVPQGMYCAMYTESWAPEYATNVGQFRPNSNGGEDFWSVSQAYAFINGTYANAFPDICATGGCPAGSYQGGSCGGWGTGTC